MSNYKLNLYNHEVSVTYRGDRYLVRNNGAVCRQRRANKRKRPLDEKWTFGTLHLRDGYRKICGTPVHRIVATAFHGDEPTSDHIVDHIDTNRINNRPKNLRWFTRLENIQDNAITLHLIEKKWGSVDGLLNDPNPADKTDPITNRPWMRQALIEETLVEESTIESLTTLGMQRDWKTPSEFPMCPELVSDTPLHNYSSRLETGTVFSRNRYGESTVVVAEFSKDGAFLSVLCMTDNGVKDWALAKVTFEGGKFIHASVGTFFTREGVEKTHCQLIGMPWDEPVGYEGCIDDYC